MAADTTLTTEERVKKLEGQMKAVPYFLIAISVAMLILTLNVQFKHK